MHLVRDKLTPHLSTIGAHCACSRYNYKGYNSWTDSNVMVRIAKYTTNLRNC